MSSKKYPRFLLVVIAAGEETPRYYRHIGEWKSRKSCRLAIKDGHRAEVVEYSGIDCAHPLTTVATYDGADRSYSVPYDQIIRVLC
jgi:hypothetical protein